MKRVVVGHSTKLPKRQDTTEPSYYAAHLCVETDAKKRVARYVGTHLIMPSDSIVLDAGSSATAVAEVLFDARSSDNLSILTHNMEVFKKFGVSAKSTTNQLILTGGAFDNSYNALFGLQTEVAYEDYYPRVVILALSGLTVPIAPELGGGFYCHAMIERRIKQILFAKPTHRRVIIADWTKVGQVDSHMFGNTAALTDGVRDKSFIVTTTPPAGIEEDRVRFFNQVIEELQKQQKVTVVTLAER